MLHRPCIAIVLLFFACAAIAQAPAFQHPADPSVAPDQQFNFWQGQWFVRSLLADTAGRWSENRLLAHVETALAGSVVLAHIGPRRPGEGMVACSIRRYDHQRQQWEVVTCSPADINTFVRSHGVFRHGRGIFAPLVAGEGEGAARQQIISDISDRTFRWEQQATLDSVAWRPVWVTEWTRTDADTPEDHRRRVVEGSAPLRDAQIGFLLGNWNSATQVRTPDGEWVSQRSQIAGSTILQGAGMMVTHTYTDADGEEAQGLWILARSVLTQEWRAAVVRQTEPVMLGDATVAGGMLTFEVANPDGPERVRVEIEKELDTQFVWERSISSDGGVTWTPISRGVCVKVE